LKLTEEVVLSTTKQLYSQILRVAVAFLALHWHRDDNIVTWDKLSASNFVGREINLMYSTSNLFPFIHSFNSNNRPWKLRDL